MPKIEGFIENWEFEFKTTLKVISAIPEDKYDFKPHEKFFSAGRLAWHIVRIEDIFGRGILGDKIIVGGAQPMEPPATVAGIIEVAQREHPQVVAGWRTLDEAQLREKIPFVRKDGQVWMELPRMVYLRTSMMAHAIHHRGQLALMLRLMGAKVPAIYGPSGDEPIGAR